jgi:predicted TIM-barrel fold metal-dependent hydrolase
VRLTAQPFDAPPDAAALTTLLEQLGSEELLLFATDYPHWHYEGTEALPAGLPEGLVRKMSVDNPLATYPRLNAT